MGLQEIISQVYGLLVSVSATSKKHYLAKTFLAAKCSADAPWSAIYIHVYFSSGDTEGGLT